MMSAKMATPGLLKITIFYASVRKGLKLKVRKFWGLIRTFVEVTGEKLVVGRGAFLPPPAQHPD